MDVTTLEAEIITTKLLIAQIGAAILALADPTVSSYTIDTGQTTQTTRRQDLPALYARLDVRSVRYEAESETLIKAGRAGAKIASVPVETIYADEHSAINPFVDTYRFFRMVVKSFFW